MKRVRDLFTVRAFPGSTVGKIIIEVDRRRSTKVKHEASLMCGHMCNLVVVCVSKPPTIKNNSNQKKIFVIHVDVH